MFTTEEDAKTKWCPFARALIGKITRGSSVEAAFTGNRIPDDQVTHGGDGHRHCACLGSGCMAWRWKNEKQHRPATYTEGRCGLAGDA